MPRGDADDDEKRGRVDAPFGEAPERGRTRRARVGNMLWWTTCALSIGTLCLWLASAFFRMGACFGPIGAAVHGGQLYMELREDYSSPDWWSAEHFYVVAEVAPHAPVSIWGDFTEFYVDPMSPRYVARPSYCWLYLPISLVWGFFSVSAAGLWWLRCRSRRLARRAPSVGEFALATAAAEKTHHLYLLIGLLAVAAYVPYVARSFIEADRVKPWLEGPILTVQLLLSGWFAAAAENLLTWAAFGPGTAIPLLVCILARLRLASARACAMFILIWAAAANLSLGWLRGSSCWTMVIQGCMPLRAATVILCMKASFRWAGAIVPLILLALLLKRAIDRWRGRQLAAVRAEGFLPATGAALIASAISCVLLTSGLWNVCDAVAGWGANWLPLRWRIGFPALSAIRTFGWAAMLALLGWRTLRTGRRPARGALWLLIGEASAVSLTLIEPPLERLAFGRLFGVGLWDGLGRLLVNNSVTAPLSLTVAWCWYRHGAAWEAAADGVPRCGSCGYNLTGNISGRCPECGMSVETDEAGQPAGAGRSRGRRRLGPRRSS